MTADEIREWHKAFEKENVTAEVARARARIEIAAQLAEMNAMLFDLMESMGKIGRFVGAAVPRRPHQR